MTEDLLERRLSEVMGDRGATSIEFRFEPKIIYVGLIITIISFLLATTYLLSPYLSSLRRKIGFTLVSPILGVLAASMV